MGRADLTSSEDVQANLLLSVRDGDTPLRRGDADGLPGRGRPKLFREVHRDGQLVPLDRHLHVLHVIPPSESK